MQTQKLFTKYISILYRLNNRFYDHELLPCQIGSGQQFFLLRIYENEGISMYDLACIGHFDKGTVTKGIQKLEEQAYIRVETDAADKRIRRLYTTAKGRSIIDVVYSIREKWNAILTDGMTPEDAEKAERLLAKMAENAYKHSCAGCGDCGQKNKQTERK